MSAISRHDNDFGARLYFAQQGERIFSIGRARDVETFI